MSLPLAVASDGFDEAYRPLFLASMRLAQRILHDRTAAEDAAAEALARAYAHWSTVRDLPHRERWVLRVTANVALDAVRRRGPAGRVQAFFEREARSRERESTGFEHQTADRDALRRALQTLPRRQREVVVLRYLAGLDEAELAETLGMNGSTVRTHLQRGLQRLRGTLAFDDLQEGPLAGS